MVTRVSFFSAHPAKSEQSIFSLALAGCWKLSEDGPLILPLARQVLATDWLET